MSSEKRGLKLHSIIEKLSEQCERNSPSHDEEGDDSTCTLEISGVKRKQRKRNEVKRVCKEALSQSDYEEESSDIELELLDEVVQGHGFQPDINGTLQELETGRRVSARLREARKNAKQHRKEPSSELIGSKKKEKLKVGVKISKMVDEPYCTGVDSDLAIDVDAFVHHLPVLEDIEPSPSSLSCPFCSVMCRDKPNLIKHIEDCHQSDCAIVDSEEEEDKRSHLESIDDDSDEEFVPYKLSSEEEEDSASDLEEFIPRTRPKNAKNEKSWKKKGPAGKASCSSINGDSVKTRPDVKNTDDSNTSSAVEWPCRSCHKKLSTKEELTIHVASCNKKAVLKDNLRVRCSCHACGMRFEEWKELREHLSKNQECRKSYQCGKCGQVFSTRGSLKKHLALHSDERPYRCNVCNAAFKDRGYLRRHVIIHSVVKNFKCEFCEKLFAHKRTLREHRMQHTGERPHKCTHCDASFTNSSSLKAHTARHTGIFPFKCQVCSRKFAKSYGLKMHSLSHSNEKPFVCEVCGKGFKRSDHLREHRIIHSENKPYKCDTCQKTFNQRVCLRKHLPCREHEKQQRKTRNSLATRRTTKSKRKETFTSSNQRTMGSESDGQKSQMVDGHLESKIAESCGTIPHDVDVTSSVENSPNGSPLLDDSQAPPSFIRTAPKLIDNDYYSGQNTAHDEYSHGSDFSSQDLPDRGRSSPISSLLPSAFIPNLSHAMFNIVDPLSLDTLPDAPVLSGRALNHEHSADLGSLLRTMDSENLNSIVEQTDSFFTHA